MDSTHAAVFVKVGEEIIASSDFALAEFPLWANRKNCRDEVTFDGRPVPTGRLAAISGTGFDDQDYQGRPVDSTAFRQPEIAGRTKSAPGAIRMESKLPG